MKLPEKIIGRHKIRDAHICLLWERDDLDVKVISEKKKLTQRRIEQILRTNHVYVPIDKEWEKRKRIKRLKSEINKTESSNKDVLYLM